MQLGAAQTRIGSSVKDGDPTTPPGPVARNPSMEHTDRRKGSVVYKALGRTADAQRLVAEQLEAARMNAERADATADEMNTYAWQLLTIEPARLRDPGKALPAALQACAKEEQSRGPNLWNYLDTLALAWHRNGNTLAAVETEKKGLALLPPDSPQRAGLQRQLADYEALLAKDREKSKSQSVPAGPRQK